MDNTHGHPTNPLARCHRVLPVLTIGLTLLAGSTNLSAQQYIAERMYDAYQAQLHTQQAKTGAKQPVAHVRPVEEPPVKVADVERTPRKSQLRPILEPES